MDLIIVIVKNIANSDRKRFSRQVKSYPDITCDKQLIEKGNKLKNQILMSLEGDSIKEIMIIPPVTNSNFGKAFYLDSPTICKDGKYETVIDIEWPTNSTFNYFDSIWLLGDINGNIKNKIIQHCYGYHLSGYWTAYFPDNKFFEAPPSTGIITPTFNALIDYYFFEKHYWGCDAEEPEDAIGYYDNLDYDENFNLQVTAQLTSEYYPQLEAMYPNPEWDTDVLEFDQIRAWDENQSQWVIGLNPDPYAKVIHVGYSLLSLEEINELKSMKDEDPKNIISRTNKLLIPCK